MQEIYPDEEVFGESFESLAECTDYFIDVLSSLNEAYNKNILTKKEFKKKKKFVMNQFNVSLKVVKIKDSHQRKSDIKSLKNPVKKTIKPVESLPALNNAKLEVKKHYQIEDKQGQTIKGQMDVEDLNGGDVYEKTS